MYIERERSGNVASSRRRRAGCSMALFRSRSGWRRLCASASRVRPGLTDSQLGFKVRSTGAQTHMPLQVCWVVFPARGCHRCLRICFAYECVLSVALVHVHLQSCPTIAALYLCGTLDVCWRLRLMFLVLSPLNHLKVISGQVRCFREVCLRAATCMLSYYHWGLLFVKTHCLRHAVANTTILQ